MLGKDRHLLRQLTGSNELLFTTPYGGAACKDILREMCADQRNPYSWSSGDGQHFELEAEHSLFYTTGATQRQTRLTGKWYEEGGRCYIAVTVIATPRLYIAILFMLFGFWAGFNNLFRSGSADWDYFLAFLIMGLLIPAGLFLLNYYSRKAILKELHRAFLVSPATPDLL